MRHVHVPQDMSLRRRPPTKRPPEARAGPERGGAAGRQSSHVPGPERGAAKPLFAEPSAIAAGRDSNSADLAAGRNTRSARSAEEGKKSLCNFRIQIKAKSQSRRSDFGVSSRCPQGPAAGTRGQRANVSRRKRHGSGDEAGRQHGLHTRTHTHVHTPPNQQEGGLLTVHLTAPAAPRGSLQQTGKSRLVRNCTPSNVISSGSR